MTCPGNGSNVISEENGAANLRKALAILKSEVNVV